MACSHVGLTSGTGQAVPWAELGKVRLGQTKPHAVVVHNTTAEEQAVSVELPDEGFEVVDAQGQPGAAWVVPAGGSISLQVVFSPQKEGRVRAVLVFRFASGAEAGRLAVSAAAVAAGPGATGAPLARPTKPGVPKPVLQPTQQQAASQPQLPLAQQREKRVRPTAGLATPRTSMSAGVGAPLTTPSMQPAKKAREVARPNARAGALHPLRAPDPATPRHAIMRQVDKPPGSVEEATPGSAVLVPRLQLGKLKASPAAAPPLGSSRGPSQEPLASARSRAPLASARGPAQLSRLGSSPATGSAGKVAAAAPKTFTHFHTSLWMDKQEVAFKAWLNTILVPAAADSAEVGQHALASRRLTAKVRGLLWRIYQRDEQFRDVMLRVEQRVLGGQLKMRDEEGCLKNLREQAQVKAVLLSYHPFWLRLGMEVVVNRVAASGDARVSAADLEVFMRDWFLRDPDLAKQHAPNKAVNGLLPKAYWVQLGQLVLSRLLLMVALLDRACTGAHLPKGVPLLFNLKSKIKGSAEVLQAILPGWLSGEGDLLRSLGRLGYKLQYEQQPKREVNFSVTTLAVDLRDGLRLCKLADILLGKDGLFDQARFPADKRPVKLHNVQLALAEFGRAGLSLDGIKTLRGASSLQAVDVIDGDREMTLNFLWRLILHFQLPQLVDPHAVRIEIDRINGTAGAAAGGCASRDHVGLLLQWAQAVCAQYGEAVPNFTSAFADGHLFCLMVNYYLGNAYLPRAEIYVPDRAAQQPQSPATSRSSSDEEDGLPGDADWRAMHGVRSAGDPAAAARHRQGVTHNFELVHRVTEALGSIPDMVSASDILEHGPDEKAVVLFTAFLCQRLMEMSKEERAAMVMQRLWRRRGQHKPGSARANLHKWIHAATVIQRAVRTWQLHKGLQQFASRRQRCIAAVTRLQAMWRAREARQQFLQQRSAVQQIQAAWRGKMERRRVFQELVLPGMLARGLQRKAQVERSRYAGRLLASATSMQALRRGSVQKRAFVRARAAAVAIQAAVRRHQASSHFQQLRGAAVVLQKFWRRRQAMQLLQRTKAAIAIQRNFRGHLVRRELQAQRGAATAVQASWRRYRAQQSFQQQRQAAIQLQAAFRCSAARKQFCELRKGAITLQRHWRGYATRRSMQEQQRAATAIQTAWRCYFKRQSFLQLRAAVVLLQSLARRKAAEQQLNTARQAAVTMQRFARGMLVRSALLRQQQAAVCIQARWRCALTRRQFVRQRQAAVTLQARVRGMQARGKFLQHRAAAVHLQSAWRGRQARLLLSQHKAAQRVQCMWRGFAVRRTMAQQAAAAVRVQAAWRCYAARASFKRQQAAAVVLQAAARRAAARSSFLRQRTAAVAIQAVWRGFATRRLLQQTHAALTMQRHARGFLVRRQQARRLEAAIIIQRCFRQHLDQKRRLAIEAMTQQMKELARTMYLFNQRVAAALKIQAVWRGHVARQVYAGMVREHQEKLRIQREKEAAAMAVIAPWAAVFRDRTWFLRARRGVRVLQRWWRREQARRRAAAIKLQAATRRFLAMRQLQRHKQAATLIQAVWRGHCVRTTHPRAKRFAELRKRLAKALANAEGLAHRSLAARTRVGLEGLLAATHLTSAVSSLETLAHCMEASTTCCSMVADAGGTAALLRLVQSASRDKSCQDALRWALLCLGHLCRRAQRAEEVFRQEGLLGLLADLLQHHRDREEVFMAGALLLQRLVAEPARALALSRMADVLAKYEGLSRLLALRLQQEQNYLAKLEGQKGSDVSARQSTRALVTLARQLQALQQVLAATGAPVAPLPQRNSPREDGGLTLGKNTIVRRTLQELQHFNR